MLTPVILDTYEAEIERIKFQSSLGKSSRDHISTYGWVQWHMPLIPGKVEV
jgi:hypothetical protein